jgi:hypothetical protein
MLVLLWRSPDVFVLVPCPDCRRTVPVRWPLRWAECRACGARAGCYAFGVPDPAPSLHPVAGGLGEATCGRCMRASPAVHPASAWAELDALGWTWYRPSTMMGAGYAICAGCSAAPHSLDGDVDAAKRRRKRR